VSALGSTVAATILGAAAPTSEPRFTGYAGAAQYLGVKAGTLRAWVSRGQVPFYRVSARLVRFRLDELDAFMALGDHPKAGHS
jgi:excisionase family DNA binding protein